MSSNNPNLFTLNPKFFQSTNSYQNYFPNLPDEFSSVKSIWMIEKAQMQEKLHCLDNELKTQKEINKKLAARIQELEAFMQRSKNKEHQRVYSIPSCGNLSNLSSHNILNTFLLSYPDHKHKKTPFLSGKFMEDMQTKNQEKTASNKENETQPQDKRRLHHQKSNSFNTKSLVIVETTNHEQKTDFTTIHVNIQEGVLNNKSSTQYGKHLFNQKKARKNTPTTFESNSNSTNLSNSNISLSGLSSHETKPKEKTEKQDKPAITKVKERLSFITTEKSMELSTESNTNTNEGNQFMKSNIANCYLFMSPAQRKKLTSIPVRRKWIVNKPTTTNSRKSDLIPCQPCLVKDTYMTRSAQNFSTVNGKINDKSKASHLYRQGTNASDLKLYANRKQYNPKFTLKNHLDGVRSLALSNDRLTLVSASEDHSLKLWDMKDLEKNQESSSTIEPFLTLRDHKGAIFTLASRDEWNVESKIPFNSLFSAGAEGVIRTWSIPRKEEVNLQRRSEDRSFCNFAWKAHEDTIWDLNLHPTQDLLLSSSSDGFLKMWSVLPFGAYNEIESFSYKQPFETQLSGSFVYKTSDIVDIPTSAIWIENQHQGICSGYVNSRNLVLFDYLEKQEIKTIFSYESEAIDARTNKLLFHQPLNCIVSAHEDKNIRIFDFSSKNAVKTFTAHNDAVTSLAINHNNPNQLISVSHDGSLRIWDLRKYQCLQELLIHRKKYDEAVQCVLSNKYTPYVITGGADACIKILKSIEG